MNLKKVTKVAFIGAGYMSREHIRAFQSIANVQVVGIYSRTMDKALKVSKEFQIDLVTSSIDELYLKTSADLVVIAVPELAVSKVCISTFKYPWAILVEKPVGYNFEDATLIRDEARKTGSRVYVALNRRHYDSTRAALRLLEGEVGQRIISVRDQEDPAAAKVAGQPKLVVDNWMYANAIHMVDYLTFMARGAVTKVEIICPWNMVDPQFVAAKIQYDSGDIAIYEALWNRPGPWSVSVSMPSLRLEMRPLEHLSAQKYGVKKAEEVMLSRVNNHLKPGLERQAIEAISAINGNPHALPTLDSALKTMKLVSLIYGKNTDGF